MLQPIQEAFVENSWDEENDARSQRDQRYAELQALGLDCKKENLYTVDGRRVFLVVATPPEEPAPTQNRTAKSVTPRLRSASTQNGAIKSLTPRLRHERSPRRIQSFEER